MFFLQIKLCDLYLSMKVWSSRLQLDVRNLSLGMRHLVNAYEIEAGTV